MEISGKMSADIKQVLIKCNKANDGREADVDLEISVRQEDAEKHWGEKFATLAFAGMVEDEDDDGKTEPKHLQETIRPKKQQFVCGVHRIGIEDEVLEAQPQLVGLRTVDGEARVVAKVRIPIDTGRDKLITTIGKKVGFTVKIDFAVQQLGLKLATQKAHETEARK
jgi:hypothetical protein